jgi:hypothetical protein
MVAINPNARPVPASQGAPLARFVAAVVRYDRAPHLATSLQLCDELAAASGMNAPLDEEPADPTPEMEERLERAILASRRSIDRERARLRGGKVEVDNFRVDPAAAYRAKQLLAQGKSDAEIRRLTKLGRKALITIKRGETPRSLNSQAADLERCPDCGGLVAADAPCLLCTVRSTKPGPSIRT